MKRAKVFSVHVAKEATETGKELNERVIDASEELTKKLNDWLDKKRAEQFKGEIFIEDIIIHTQACGTNHTAHFFLTATVKYKHKP